MKAFLSELISVEKDEDDLLDEAVPAAPDPDFAPDVPEPDENFEEEPGHGESDSTYTCSGVGISGATAALRNFKSGLALTDTKTEVSDQKLWKFSDLMDLLQSFWSDQVHEMTSVWCDMVYPQVALLYETRYEKALGCVMEESWRKVQHILMIALFLHWGTGVDMVSCLRVLLAHALPVWRQGRRVFRPLWDVAQVLAEERKFQQVKSQLTNETMVNMISICLDVDKMTQVFEGWDGDFAPTTEDTSKQSEVYRTKTRSHTVCVVVGIFGDDEELESFSLWIYDKGDPLDAPSSEKIQILDSHSSVEAALEALKGPQSLLTGHPQLDQLWEAAGIYDVSSHSSEGSHDVDFGLTSHTGDRGLWTLYLNHVMSTMQIEDDDEKLKEGLHVQKDASSTTQGLEEAREGEIQSEMEETDVTCETIPTRMFEYVSRKNGGRSSGSALAVQLTRAQNLGAFALVELGESLGPWYYDPGSALSQITPEEIEKCGGAMTLVPKGRVHFVCAESTLTLQACEVV